MGSSEGMPPKRVAITLTAIDATDVALILGGAREQPARVLARAESANREMINAQATTAI